MERKSYIRLCVGGINMKVPVIVITTEYIDGVKTRKYTKIEWVPFKEFCDYKKNYCLLPIIGMCIGLIIALILNYFGIGL